LQSALAAIFSQSFSRGAPEGAEMYPLNLTQLVLAEGRETGSWRTCRRGHALQTFRRSA